jgi:hypothetical protein
MTELVCERKLRASEEQSDGSDANVSLETPLSAYLSPGISANELLV